MKAYIWTSFFLWCLLPLQNQAQQSTPPNRQVRIRQALQTAQSFDGINADSVSPHAQYAQSLLQETDSLRLRYDVYQTLSRAHYLQNQQQQMRQASETSLEIAQQIGDSLLQARAYRSLAMATPAVSRAEAKAFIQQSIAYSQGPDKASKRFQILAYQIYAYLIKYEAPHEAHALNLKILQQAQDIQDTALIAKSYETIGTYYRNFQVDSAIYFYRQSKALYEQTREESLLASLLGKFGTCYQLKDRRDSILFYGNQAYELGKRTGNVAAQRSGMKILIHHYIDQGEFETALQFAEDLLRLDKAKPSGYRSMIYLDLGEVYEGMGEAEKAYAYYQQALEQATADRYPPGMATARVKLGEADLKAGKWEAAKQQFRVVDGMYARMNIEAARVQTFEQLGKIALLQRNWSEARTQFEQLLGTAEKLADISAQAAAHRGLSRCDSALGRINSAFTHISQFAALTDSFHRNNFNETVAELQTQLETERKENQIQLLKQESQLQQLELSQTQRERNFYRLLGMGAICIAGIVGFFLFLLNKSRLQIQTQAEELLSLNQTKDDLFGIIAHDLKGPISGFQVLGRVFSHYLPENSPNRLKQITLQLEQQSTHLNRLLDNLLQWALQQLGRYQAELKPFSLATLTQEIADLNTPAALAKNNKLILDVPESFVLQGDVRGWSIVLNNLISNAIKFTDQGEIEIALKEDGKGNPVLHIQDTGVGMSEEQLAKLKQTGGLLSTNGTLGEKGTGLGLRIVRQLVEEWGQTLQIESEKGIGTTLTISLPY